MTKNRKKLNYFFIIKFYNVNHLYKIQIIFLIIIILKINYNSSICDDVNRFFYYDRNKCNNNTQINKNYTNYYHQYFGHIRKFITNDIIKRKELVKNRKKKPNLKINSIGVDSSLIIANFSFNNYLSKYFKIEISNNPDYVYYGSDWDGIIKYSDAINICVETENIFPDMNKCDYAIGYPFQIVSDRYIQKSYANWFLHYNQQIKNARKNVIRPRNKFCGAMISNSLGKFRNIFLNKLNKYKTIDNAGKFKKNVIFVNNPNIDRYQNKINFLRQYKFSIAMENSFNTGYVTEKIITCFLAGTIPIYYGDVCLEYFINPKTFIQIKPWDDFTEKIILIKKIDNDDKLYFNMLKEDINLDSLFIKLQEQDFQDMADYIFFQDKKKAKRRNDSQFVKLI